MRSKIAVSPSIRASLLALVVGALVLLSVAVSSASAAEGGFEKFFAGNCKLIACGEGAVPPTVKEEEEKGFRQAGGYVPFGVTDFTLNKFPIGEGVSLPVGFPTENLKKLRVDVAPGVVTNGIAVPTCSLKDFTGKAEGEFFSEPNCPASSIIGENKLKQVIQSLKPVGFEDVPLSGKVYNLEPAIGQSTTYGVALQVRRRPRGAHDHSGQRRIQRRLPRLLRDRKHPSGTARVATRLLRQRESEARQKKSASSETRPRATNVGPETTTTVTGEFVAGASVQENPARLRRNHRMPRRASKFEPTFALEPGIGPVRSGGRGHRRSEEYTHPPTAKPDTADLKTATIKMPEGMTMNPSAAAGARRLHARTGRRQPVEHQN